MSIGAALLKRGDSKCEFCKSDEDLSAYDVPPITQRSMDKSVLVCSTCLHQIENETDMDANHWRCLNDSMWHPELAVQVLSYRLLHALRSEGWPQDLLEIMYLEEEAKAWADLGLENLTEETDHLPTKDSNGTPLQEGDNVTLIKDLVVKGANFTAKRGTLVKNIHLTNNPLHIEGKVNGTQIVLVAAFLKKA